MSPVSAVGEKLARGQQLFLKILSHMRLFLWSGPFIPFLASRFYKRVKSYFNSKTGYLVSEWELF